MLWTVSFIIPKPALLELITVPYQVLSERQRRLLTALLRCTWVKTTIKHYQQLSLFWPSGNFSGVFVHSNDNQKSQADTKQGALRVAEPTTLPVS